MTLPAFFGEVHLLLSFGVAAALRVGSGRGTGRTLDSVNEEIGQAIFV
jgi:hypothetical protein